MMIQNLNRRTLVKGAAAGAAGAAALATSKHSKVFAAPNVISQTGSDITINYWHGFGGVLGDRMAEVVEGFNAEGTGVQVELLQQASYEETAQNLTLSLQDGSNPDVALLSDVWWFRFYLANQLLPLNDLINARDYDTADLVESLYVEGVRQDTSYWLPFARSTPLFYYNVDMFEAAGISELPETWSEFAAIAPDVMEANGVPTFGHPDGASYIAWLFHGVAWAFGGGYSDGFDITIDQEGTINAGEFYRASTADGWAIVTDPETDLSNGLLAACMASTGSLARVTADAEAAGVNLRTAFLRAELPDVEQYCPTGGAGMSIISSIDAERQEAAFSFIEYCTSTEVTTTWSQNTGYMPVRNSAIQSEEMQAFFEENPNFQVAVEQLAITKPQDAARVFIPGGDQIIGSGLEEITLNNVPAEEAFATVKEILEAEVAELQLVEQLEAREGAGATPAARR